MVSMTSDTNNSREESFAALFEESLKHEDVKEGDIVKGTVIQVGKDHVVVDIGESWRLAEVLGSKGIPNRVDPWGPDWHHDWPTWRKMLPQYLEEWTR